MRKIFIIIAVFILSIPFAKAQRYYFFCVNIGEKSDGAYIARTINSALSKLEQDDAFTIYIRGGISSEGKIFDSELIEDVNQWKEVESVLGYVENYTVLPKPELDNMLRLFQNRYQVGSDGLQPNNNIVVYWFGDQDYYQDYGQELLLKFYFACAGEQTWRLCQICPDRANGFGKKTLPQLLGNAFSDLSNVVLRSSDGN